VKQAGGEKPPEANKINASTPYDFDGKNLTPYGGLLPVITMLEKLGFESLVEELLTMKRATRAMSGSRFVLAIVLGIYVGFARLSHLRFIARDPLVTGILEVAAIPAQSTLWRFLAALHISVSRQLLKLQQRLRERVWAAANVRLKTITVDTDTTVHTLYGRQMGARKSYNPKNKGKKSYQPILTFLAETKEYVSGQLRNGDRPTGKQIADHLREVFQSIPETGATLRARADSGFYCWEAIEGLWWWRAKRRGWWRSCARRIGRHRRRPMRMRSASSSIDPTDGSRSSASWLCATTKTRRRRRRRRRRRSLANKNLSSNTSCSNAAR
jgi:hypothetical protein